MLCSFVSAWYDVKQHEIDQRSSQDNILYKNNVIKATSVSIQCVNKVVVGFWIYFQKYRFKTWKNGRTDP